MRRNKEWCEQGLTCVATRLCFKWDASVAHYPLNDSISYIILRDVAQLVARLLWEQDVAGSNPVIPTIKGRLSHCDQTSFFLFGQIPVFDVCLRHTKSCFAFGECFIPTKNEDLSHRDQVLFAFFVRFQSLTYAFGIPNLVSPLANVAFRPKKQLSPCGLVVFLLGVSI